MTFTSRFVTFPRFTSTKLVQFHMIIVNIILYFVIIIYNYFTKIIILKAIIVYFRSV